MGVTFKENTPDIRNSQVVTLIEAVIAQHTKVYISDPLASSDQFQSLYNLKLSAEKDIPPCHATILAVPHAQYIARRATQFEAGLTAPNPFFDVKRCLSTDTFSSARVRYCRL